MQSPIKKASVATILLFLSGYADACTRDLYVGADNTVITGRSMDWDQDMRTNLWVFPKGIERTSTVSI